MSNLKKLVNEIKSLIKNEEVSEIGKLVLSDINGTEVVFEEATLEDIHVGTKASPDGEFIFIDNMKVKIENGEVVEVTREIEVPEEVVNQVAEEIKNEGGEPEPVQEPAPEPAQEPSSEPDEKDKLIEELQTKVSELTGQLEAITSQLQEATKSAEEKQAEIEEVSNELSEIKNFYTKVTGEASRSSVTVEPQKTEKFEGFKFSRK